MLPSIALFIFSLISLPPKSYFWSEKRKQIPSSLLIARALIPFNLSQFRSPTAIIFHFLNFSKRRTLVLHLPWFYGEQQQIFWLATLASCSVARANLRRKPPPWSFCSKGQQHSLYFRMKKKRK